MLYGELALNLHLFRLSRVKRCFESFEDHAALLPEPLVEIDFRPRLLEFFVRRPPRDLRLLLEEEPSDGGGGEVIAGIQLSQQLHDQLVVVLRSQFANRAPDKERLQVAKNLMKFFTLPWAVVAFDNFEKER